MRVVVDLELGRGFGYGLEDRAIAGFAVAVTWSDAEGFLHWDGTTGRDLLHYLLRHDEIVGFNLLAYDNPVLQGYLLPAEQRLAAELRRRTVDLHALLYHATGRRYALETVSRATLGEGKLIPPANGDPVALAEYCAWDVELTRDLDDFRRAYGVLYVAGGEPVHLAPAERPAASPIQEASHGTTNWI